MFQELRYLNSNSLWFRNAQSQENTDDFNQKAVKAPKYCVILRLYLK